MTFYRPVKLSFLTQIHDPNPTRINFKNPKLKLYENWNSTRTRQTHSGRVFFYRIRITRILLRHNLLIRYYHRANRLCFFVRKLAVQVIIRRMNRVETEVLEWGTAFLISLFYWGSIFLNIHTIYDNFLMSATDRQIFNFHTHNIKKLHLAGRTSLSFKIIYISVRRISLLFVNQSIYVVIKTIIPIF